MAAEELANAAARAAKGAIVADSQGSRGKAIQLYQESIDLLLKLVRLYPDYSLNKTYMKRATTYQERIRALQSGHGLDGEEGGEATAPEALGEQTPSSIKVVEPLKASYSDLVLKTKPNVKWTEVMGLEDAKRALRESIVFPRLRPDLFPLGWPRGILLYGPPGCGKTMLAAAVAAEMDAAFFNVDAASIMSKWLGEAERNVAKLFTSARRVLEKEGSSAIVFIDEVDSLLGQRNQEVGGEVRVRNQFLKEMDGLEDKGKDLRLYVIGATNKPWSLDWPFLRRFQKRIYVPTPDHDTRGMMLQQYVGLLNIDPEVKTEDLVKLAEGYTGSDIRDICQTVQLRVVDELFESGKASEAGSRPRTIVMEDFRQVLAARKPSVSQNMIRAYHQWSEAYKAA